MNTAEKIALLKKRFIHRDDVFSRQWYRDGKMGYTAVREGTCPRVPPCPKGTCPHITDVPLSDRELLDHLQGKQTIAIYQMREENTVTTLCIDVDIKKGIEGDFEHVVKEHTKTLAKVIHRLLGTNSFLVEHSGRRGYHLWVFFEEPVPAFKVHSLGHYIDAQVEHPFGIDVEVYPKQTQIHSYGSMIKLPLGIHKVTGHHCFFVDNTFREIVGQWDRLANVRSFTEQELTSVLTEHQIALVFSIRVDSQHIPSYGALPCMTNMMTEGLQEGMRDEGFLRLASWMKRRGIPEDIAQVSLVRVNEKTKPPLDAQTVDNKIENAYNNDHTEFPCNNAAFDSFCTSQCRYFQNKSDRRWRRFGKEGDGRGTISRD